MASYTHYFAETVARKVMHEYDRSLARHEFPEHDDLTQLIRETIDNQLEVFRLRLASVDDEETGIA